MLIGDAVASIQSEGFQGLDPEGLFAVIPVVIALAAFIISWWMERIGSFLLILAYLVLSFSPSIHALFYGWGFNLFIDYTLPFMIAGVLFLIDSRLSSETS
jgi:hypothetical protein